MGEIFFILMLMCLTGAFIIGSLVFCLGTMMLAIWLLVFMTKLGAVFLILALILWIMGPRSSR